MKNTSSVSVIIITCNNSTIFKCIDCLKHQIVNGDEIIVVEDDSTEEYHSSLKTYCMKQNVILLQAKKHGNRAYNRNLGARRAKNPILIFLDADMLLLDTSISALKDAYATKNSAAFIGMRSAGRYDPLRMSIVSGINVQEAANNQIKLDYLSELPSIRDTRISATPYRDELPEQKYYWVYYYTCCCSVWRELFIHLGGFDENYSGWGVEDIDLGYRIAATKNISFLRGFGGIHMPHRRDVLYAESDNFRNLKRLLKKAQTFDVEFISIYRVSAAQLEQIKEFLNRVRMFDLPLLCPENKKDTIYINSVSTKAPYGKMIHFGKNGERKTYHLIGVGTFFEDKSINEVIVSGGIVLYPPSVICGILQESIRIGKKVILSGPLPACRLDWSGFPNLTLVQAQKRNEYRIHDIMEFQFEKVPNRDQYIVTSDYLELEDLKNIPTKLSLDNLKTAHLPVNIYCVINLTRGTGYRLLIKQIKNSLCLRYVGIYSTYDDLSIAEPRTKFPEHLYGLLELNTPILVVVESLQSFCFDFPRWQERDHANDIIVDLSGAIYYPKSWGS